MKTPFLRWIAHQQDREDCHLLLRGRVEGDRRQVERREEPVLRAVDHHRVLQEVRVFVVGRDRVRANQFLGTVDGPLRRHDERRRDHQRGGHEEADVEEEGAHCCVLVCAAFGSVWGCSPCVLVWAAFWFGQERRV